MLKDNYLRKVTQSLVELEGLVALLQAEGVKSFLEVGSRWGGSLWKIANELPRGSKVVSVDSGGGTGKRAGSTQSLMECIIALRKRGYDARVIMADSQATVTVKNVERMGPYDAVFIDAGHDLQSVTADWHNYGPMARIVAFHDVANDPARNTKKGPTAPVDVPQLWRTLRRKYRHVEFIDPPFNMGIGVLWR